MSKFTTIEEATREWVREMDAIQQGIVSKLMKLEPDEWTEVTVPSVGNRVYVDNVPDDCTEYCGTIEEYDDDNETYKVKLDDGTMVDVETEDLYVERDDVLPMWGTMWSFGDSADVYWLEEDDGIKLMSDCGFRIYCHEEYGYFFGIDGAGYSFYEAHWIPLYKARGLRWHNTELEQQEDSDDE